MLAHTSRLQLVFFFFQAEDGIRDLTVTGVQTCALPISDARARSIVPAIARECARRAAKPGTPRRDRDQERRASCALSAHVGATAMKSKRSEERRVGKECRSRWSPYH